MENDWQWGSKAVTACKSKQSVSLCFYSVCNLLLLAIIRVHTQRIQACGNQIRASKTQWYNDDSIVIIDQWVLPLPQTTQITRHKQRWGTRTSSSPSVAAAGVQGGQIGAVGEGGGDDAGLRAHVGAGHAADLAVGAAVVAVVEAEGGRGRRGRRHQHGDEEEGNHRHLGVRHCCYGGSRPLVGSDGTGSDDCVACGEGGGGGVASL